MEKMKQMPCKKNRYKRLLAMFYKQYDREIIKGMDDGSLNVFTNSVNAVWCAVETQGDYLNNINNYTKPDVLVMDIRTI